MVATTLYLQWPSQHLGQLHRSMQTKASLGRLVSFLTGQSRNLLDLSTVVSKGRINQQYYAGSRSVPINQIKGSEGRSHDFDRDFNPTQNRTFDRWMSVAAAYSSGASLPAVDLIQLGEDYFVRDGHHRISVARAFNQEFIDAKVVVLKLEQVSADPK